MASATRSILRALSLGSSIHGRRVLHRHSSRVFSPGATPWGTRPILSSIEYGYSSRGYSSSSGAGETNWDGLVYSMMSNLRGQVTYGPECFYADTDSSDEKEEKRKDMRVIVPLRLNRPSLGQTAQDIRLRLTTLCKSEQYTTEYTTILRLVALMERLAAMPSDDPKLELSEYVEIWTGIRDGVTAANQMSFQVLSINEGEELKHVKWNAEAVWGVAMLNAAVKGLEGTRIADDNGDQETGQERQVTFSGDLRSMAYKIHGLLLDSKDFFPDERWFTTEQEEQILGAIIRAYNEYEKRSNL